MTDPNAEPVEWEEKLPEPQDPAREYLFSKDEDEIYATATNH